MIPAQFSFVELLVSGFNQFSGLLDCFHWCLRVINLLFELIESTFGQTHQILFSISSFLIFFQLFWDHWSIYFHCLFAPWWYSRTLLFLACQYRSYFLLDFWAFLWIHQVPRYNWHKWSLGSSSYETSAVDTLADFYIWNGHLISLSSSLSTQQLSVHSCWMPVFGAI